MLSASCGTSGKIEEVKLTLKAESAGLCPEKVCFENFLFLGDQKSALMPFLKDTELIAFCHELSFR